jgi:hypothetical protein
MAWACHFRSEYLRPDCRRPSQKLDNLRLVLLHPSPEWSEGLDMPDSPSPKMPLSSPPLNRDSPDGRRIERNSATIRFPLQGEAVALEIGGSSFMGVARSAQNSLIFPSSGRTSPLIFARLCNCTTSWWRCRGQRRRYRGTQTNR